MRYLTIDIGASSGRHTVSWLENGKLKMEEIYRFENKTVFIHEQLCWDISYLFEEIKNGLKLSKNLNLTPDYLGIDTWGVDFVLLDEENSIIGNSVSYRDARTNGMDEIIEKFISQKELYERTGIQKQLFNTIYQLSAVNEQNGKSLKSKNSFLMIPDYFNFLLTGKKVNEYTNATTTQLVNIDTGNWDFELMELIGINQDMFNEIKHPGYKLGGFTKEIQAELGFNSIVVLPATHDTSSAVMSVPYSDIDSLYISSGTWSLMGVKNETAIINEIGRKFNFTNSGGYNQEYLFLKNIMGLWLIQEFKREINNLYTYSELCDLASKEEITTIINCNHQDYLSPRSMIDTIKKHCIESNQTVPNSIGEFAAVIYNSLAVSYRDTVSQFIELSNRKINSINIVGGGSQADYLNQKTADTTGLDVYAGPVEATTIGNAISQMISSGEIKNLSEANSIVRNSFEIKKYIPEVNY